MVDVLIMTARKVCAVPSSIVVGNLPLESGSDRALVMSVINLTSEPA
jgi:hypothetical protein